MINNSVHQPIYYFSLHSVRGILFFVILNLLSINSISAQKLAAEKKGDDLYKNFFFYEAIDVYEGAKYLSIDGKRKLAESYRKVGNFEKSEIAYLKFIDDYYATPDDYFNFSLVCKALGKYHDAGKWLLKFAEVRPQDLRTLYFKKTKDDFKRTITDQGIFAIKNLKMNDDNIDFAPAFYKNDIVFASTRGATSSVVRKYNWNKRPFLNLYVAKIGENSELVKPENFHRSFNMKWHEGTASFAKNGTLLAYTGDDYQKKSADGGTKLQIFFSEYTNGAWSKPKSFKYNSPEYNTGHPCLSEDGNTLYFSSDRPGGFGGVDIYKSVKDESGNWGEPQNLGKYMNTEFNEMFPFFEEKSKTLFYASNGLNGLGGLDVYYARLINNNFTTPLNLGFPINTQYDDFGFIIDQNLKKGYFSSNRVGGKGDDDIYSFDVLKSFFSKKKLIGVAKNRKGELLPSTSVTLYDNTNNPIETVITPENGAYEFEVDADRLYSLNGVKPRYRDGKNVADTHTPDDVVVADVELNLSQKKIIGVAKDKSGEILSNTVVNLMDNKGKVLASVTTDVDGDYSFPAEADKLYLLTGKKPQYLDGKNRANTSGPEDVVVADVILQNVRVDKLIHVDPIYFDLDKANIRPDAALVLDKIVAIMNEYPTMVIELGSHTDCRSSAAYNMDLSTRRAKSSAAYIKARITHPERIYGKGYGESQLLVNCPCEGKVKSTCPEEEHQKNRRTEFKIIKM